MNDKTDKWFKWDYVCPNCDANIEMTLKSTGHPHSEICSKCYERLTLMSVVDVTIYPNQQKEEQTMETTIAELYNPNLLVTYKKIENGEVSYATEEVTDIEYALDLYRRNYKMLTDKQNDWFLQESKLRTLLEEVYVDSEDQESLAQIAEIFNVPLTKEIEVTVYIRVDATVEVDMREGDYDLEDMVRNQITIDAYGSEISVNDYEVERVEEGAY